MSDYLCPTCGHMLDTPMHEIGCGERGVGPTISVGIDGGALTDDQTALPSIPVPPPFAGNGDTRTQDSAKARVEMVATEHDSRGMRADVTAAWDALRARVEELEKAMAAEARIVEAQTLDLKALAKGRREILTAQVERMRRCALGGPGRHLTYSENWRDRVASDLDHS